VKPFPPLADRPGPSRRRSAWIDIAIAGAAPGVLLGALVAGLLFFLNPHLPFTVWTVARAIGLYGLILGSLSLAIHLPFVWNDRRRARRAVPWGLSAILGVMAIYDWSHASYYAFYLPQGINDRLTKAGVWLAAAGLISFYTALLHTLHRRSYGPRSRLLFLALTVAAIYAQLERREAFRPRVAPEPRPATVEAARRPRLVMVGLESATLDAVLPLAEQGRLDFLSRCVRGGAYGRLGTLTPTRRPALWTTLATGKLPFKHAILGPRRYGAPFLGKDLELWLLPRGLAFQSWGTFGADSVPIDATHKQARSLWDVLAELGVAAGVVGWPVTSPPPPRLDFALSDRFFSGEAAEGNAYPPDVAARAAAERVAPERLDPAVRRGLGRRPGSGVIRAAAGDQWREAVILRLAAERPETEALFVDLPGLQNIVRRYYGGYAAVHLEGQHDEVFERAAQVVEAYYTHLDGFLGALVRQAGPGALVAVVSAFGVDGPSKWQKARGLTPQAQLPGDFDRGADGVLLLYGEGVRPGVLLPRARVADVAPTLLYAMGLPVARDLDGRALTEAFTPEFLAAHPLNFVPSYETLSGATP